MTTTEAQELLGWARTYLRGLDLPPVTHRAVTLLLAALNDAENQRDDARAEVRRLYEQMARRS